MAQSPPWYASEVNADSSGRLSFVNRAWWGKAQALKEGESLPLDLNGSGHSNAIVRRDHGDLVEAVDETNKAQDPWNQLSTIYLVSYGGSGSVDRMVAYFDTNGDGKVDEIEIRYYKDGQLRFGLFGENFDNDGIPIFELQHWEYFEGGLHNKRRGNLLIYYNKYDAQSRGWIPWSECPFAFLDADHRGNADTVLRVSAVPSESLTGSDLDFANSVEDRWSAKTPAASDVVIANIRLSYGLDVNGAVKAPGTPHFTFGFTMSGNTPYAPHATPHFNPLRAEPQTVYRMNPVQALDVGRTYRAETTGFTWDESGMVNRWEGQFWTYDRRPIANTGGPTRRWDMRREFTNTPQEKRQLYYSAVDKRIHLFGAAESWMEVGHNVGDGKDLEIRATDEDHDGYLDTWQVFAGDNPTPMRTTHVNDPRATLVELDRVALSTAYSRNLPQAIAEDEELIAKLKGVASDRMARAYERAAETENGLERKRLLLDTARELYYLRALEAIRSANSKLDDPARPTVEEPHSEPMRFLSPFSYWIRHPRWAYTRWRMTREQHSIESSTQYWRGERQIHDLEEHYGAGEFEAASADLTAIVASTPITRGTSTRETLVWLLIGIALVVALRLLRRRSRGSN